MDSKTQSAIDRTLPPLLLVVVCAVALLSPVHNDTWWHIAYGREMSTSGGFAQFDFFSHTAYGRPFPNHQWLGERAMFSLWSAGGLPLLTAGCAFLLVAGWVLCWRLTRGAVADRIMLVGAAIASSTLVWSLRPQAFTVALLPLVTFLVIERRLWLVPLVILVWTNLHGGVLLGLVVLGVALTAAVLDVTRSEPGGPAHARCRALARCLVLSVAVTAVSPLGLNYWPEIFHSLARSQVNGIYEWTAPAPPPEHLFFWLALAALTCLAGWRWRSLEREDDRVLVLAALALVAGAARTLRNIAPFMMLAAPAISRLLPAGRSEPGARHRLPPTSRALVAVAAFVAAGLIAHAWRTPWQRLGWRPISPGAIAAIAACPAPIYNAYGDGGAIIWFVPGQRVFLDSRQDHYPDGLVRRGAQVDVTADYRALFQEFGIRCAALSAGSALSERLHKDGWQPAFDDGQWSVHSRP